MAGLEDQNEPVRPLEEQDIKTKDEMIEEGIAARFRNSRAEPTQEEIDEHVIDHGTFREWCPIVLKAEQ